MIITHSSSSFGATTKESTNAWKAWGFLDFLVMKAGVVADIEIDRNEQGQLQFDITCGCLVDHYTIENFRDEATEVYWLLALYIITWRRLRFDSLTDDEWSLGRHAAEQIGLENWKPTTRDETPQHPEVSFATCARWALCAAIGFEVNVLDFRASCEAIVSALTELNTARPNLKQLEELLSA